MSDSKASWWDRHPAVIPVLASIAFLQLFQGISMALKFSGMGPAAAAGLGTLGVMLAPLTLLLLLPLILWLRRLHPAWADGDRVRASWAASFGVASALAGWMIADQITSAGGLTGGTALIFEALFVLAVGWAAASWVVPPKKWLKILAASVPVILAASMVIAGMAQPPPPEISAQPEARKLRTTPATAKSPDVILVSIDTLRADRLGSYGRSPSITPNLDRVADEGVVFRRALAAAPWTVPSVAAMLTGLPTLRHQAGRASSSGQAFLRTPLDDNFTTLAERFAASGYRTLAVSANGFVSPETGMAQGFEIFASPFSNAVGSGIVRDLPLPRFILSLIPERKLGDYRAEGVTDQALAWLQQEDDRPLFLWVHYLGPHIPLRADPNDLALGALQEMVHERLPPTDENGSVLGEVFIATSHVRSGMLRLSPEDRQALAERYDLAVSYVDEHAGRLFDALRKRQGRSVIAALTSDHGEELWDHGHFEHGHDYYSEVTRIPLIFWSPGRLPEGQVVPDLAGHVDLSPTLLELAALNVPPAAGPDEGRSLVPLWQPAPEAADAATASEADSEAAALAPSPTIPRFSGGNLYGLPAVLVEEDRWRCILRANGQLELYDVELDPAERFNVAQQHPEVAAKYQQLLEPRLNALLDADGANAELSTEALEALRSLGYIN